MPHSEDEVAPQPEITSNEVVDTVMTDSASNIPETNQKPNNATTSTALTDLFSSDASSIASDDEFPSSAPNTNKPAAVLAPLSAPSSDPSVLMQYYSHLFPFSLLTQWLSSSSDVDKPSTHFTNREFAFVLPSEAYIRYQSFPSAAALRKQCLQMTPLRFEIGPEYTLNPRDRKSVKREGVFRPVRKELVFDIDMTDYDPVRICCQGASICKKCWRLAVIAIKVVDRALREDFGFKHILWVYSGRRGVHCWVSDRRARELEDGGRKAIAGYLELLRKKAGGKQEGVVRRGGLHPHVEYVYSPFPPLSTPRDALKSISLTLIRRSLSIIDSHFPTDTLEVQNPFIDPSQTTHLLSLIPDSSLTTALVKKWESSPSRSSSQKYADIDALAASGNLTITPQQLINVKQDIRLEYTYPRLDAAVSKKLNHLLKSPFVIHPGTGRVCVPIDVRNVDDFDPFAVPTVLELLGEIDRLGNDGGEKVMKTRMGGYITFFQEFVDELIRDGEGMQKDESEKVQKKRGADGLDF